MSALSFSESHCHSELHPAIIHVSAYRFIPLPEELLIQWVSLFKKKAIANQLKGTILLSTEGINLFLAGLPHNVAEFQHFLAEWPQLADLWYKESLSTVVPYDKMVVKVKKEIVSMGMPDFLQQHRPAPYVAPKALHQWYEQSQDMVVLDARNRFEVELGSFDHSVHLDLQHFRDFPKAIEKLSPPMKHKKIVTFCTGGIRCEKAATYLITQGFQEVYQLEGGILNYFEQCGRAYYHGQCFVFDNRVAVGGSLLEVNRG